MAQDIKIEVIQNVVEIDTTTNVVEIKPNVNTINIHNSDGLNGITPHIGENGNWWIGTTDTGVHAQGEKGEQGEQGIQGEKGADGKDGKSAYEQAVDGGFIGTEQEFINSLNNLNEIKNIMPLVYAGL